MRAKWERGQREGNTPGNIKLTVYMLVDFGVAGAMRCCLSRFFASHGFTYERG